MLACCMWGSSLVKLDVWLHCESLSAVIAEAGHSWVSLHKPLQLGVPTPVKRLLTDLIKQL